MTEADLMAANGRAAPLASQTSTLPLLLHSGRPGLVVLARKPGDDGRTLAQRFHPIERLIGELPGRGASGDWYVSASSFRRRCRKMQHLAGLRACFLDLDFYKLARWSDCAPTDVWAAAQEELIKSGLPLPQAVVSTGRGLQLVWSLGHLPVGALPRWQSVQRHLAGVLLTLGADRGALDACRILRLPGTTNSKSGVEAAFLHVDLDGVTAFEDLATAVLPLARRVLRARRQHRAGPTLGVSAKARRASGWIGIILTDIRRLIAFRWDGRVPEGSRNTVLFVYGTFLARATGVSGLTDTLRTFAARVCDLDAGEVDQIIASIAKKLEEGGYRFAVANAAAALAITPEEVRLAGLRRLWPADAELDAALKAAKRKRDRQYQRQRRQAAGARPRDQSLARTRPWHALGISRASYYRRRVDQQSAGEHLIRTETNSSSTTGGGSPVVPEFTPPSGPRRSALRSVVHGAGVDPRCGRHRQGRGRGNTCRTPAGARASGTPVMPRTPGRRRCRSRCEWGSDHERDGGVRPASIGLDCSKYRGVVRVALRPGAVGG